MYTLDWQAPRCYSLLPLHALVAVAACLPSALHKHHEDHACSQVQLCEETLLEDKRNHLVLNALAVLVPVPAIL